MEHTADQLDGAEDQAIDVPVRRGLHELLAMPDVEPALAHDPQPRYGLDEELGSGRSGQAEPRGLLPAPLACEDLAERPLHWQWPDGGWNCDKNPAADTSSFCETLLPMRGPAAYSGAGNGAHGGVARAAVGRAAEVLLVRRLAYRVSTGELTRPEFAKLHYPLYWHYDVLGGLKAMADVSMLGDARCGDALDLLESLRLADALAVLHAAGRSYGGEPALVGVTPITPDRHRCRTDTR